MESHTKRRVQTLHPLVGSLLKGIAKGLASNNCEAIVVVSVFYPSCGLRAFKSIKIAH